MMTKPNARLKSVRHRQYPFPFRLLINTRLYGAGGIETHLLQLCRLLVKHNVEITLLARYAHESTPLVRLSEEIPIRIISTPFAQDISMYRLSTLTAFASWPFSVPLYHFDVLITTELTQFISFLSYFVKPDGHILQMRAGLPAEPNEYHDPRLLDLISGVLVETQIQADAARIIYPPRIKISVNPHLGHIAEVLPQRNSRTVDVLQVAYLGRYDRKKGIYQLLEIWPQLQIGRAELHFFGHGSEKEALIAAIAKKNLSQFIHVHDGWHSAIELTALLDAVDLVVLASQAEGLPIVLLETLANGVPFVATDVGAVRTLAQHNRDVRVVPLDNSHIIKAIEELAQEIRAGNIDSKRIQNYYTTHFGYEKLSQSWLEVITQVSSWVREKG